VRYLQASLFAACFAAGWWVNGLYHDSTRLASELAARTVMEAAMSRESTIAATLETRLQELKANETTIIREQIKVVDRPVYRNVCLDGDGVRIANAAKNGTSSAKPTDPVQDAE